MADSNITCSGLAVASGIAQLSLSWVVTNPHEGGLPYLDLATVEVHRASVNNRASAVKVGEGLNAFLDANVSAGDTRFYWVRPRDVSGLYGDWFPLSATAGVSGTAATAQPGPGSITAVELAPDSVTNAAIAPAAVNTTEIADAAIARAKLAFAAVGTAQIDDAAITQAKIGSAAIGAAQIENGAITNAKIANAAIDNAKISSLSADKITFGTLSGITVNAVTMNGVQINSGFIDVTDVVCRYLVGIRMLTQTLGPRIEMQAAELKVWNSLGTNTIRLGTASFGAVAPLAITSSQVSAFSATFANSAAGAVGASSPTWAFYATSGAYGPFTAGHELLWPIDEPLPEIGDLIADDGVILRNGISNTLCKGRVATADKPAIGVLAAEIPWSRTAAMGADMTDEDVEAMGRDYRLILVNALGEGQMNVLEDAGILAGDFLIVSDVPGKATRQSDDIMRANTVGRARESSSGRTQIACIYVGG